MNVNDLMTIGDSYSSAICSVNGVEVNQAGWPQMLGIPANHVLSLVGSTVMQWSSNFAHRMETAKACPATVCISSMMGNDLLQALKQNKRITQAMIKAEAHLYRKVLQKVNKPQMYVMQYADPFQNKIPALTKWLTKLNDNIAAAVQDMPNCQLVDCRPLLDASCFSGGDMHPNKIGHEKLTAHFRELLQLT